MEGIVVDRERTERRDIKDRNKYINMLNYFLITQLL